MLKMHRRLLNLALGLISGVLLALPFLATAFWWLHYVALVPWVLLLTRPEVRGSWLYLFAGAFVFFSMALSPFALFHKTVPYALAVFYAPFLLPFAVLLREIYLRFRTPLTVVVPVVWVATEWLRLRFSIGQVAIFPLGTSHFSQLKLIQIADITGVAGVSFTVACASGAVADLLLRPKTGGWRYLWPAGAFLLLLISVYTYGTYREARRELLDGPRVALVQPNVTHYRDPAMAKTTFAEQLEFTRAELTPGSADLIVLPENTISTPIGDDLSYAEELGKLAREQKARLVVGAFSRASLVPPRVYT